MGWIGDLLKKAASTLVGAPPFEPSFVPSLSSKADIPGIGEPIEPDACYVELYIESLRLERARRFATKFHGVVYSYVNLQREGTKHATLAAISKPDKLVELDKNALDRVITVSKQMMGATAFRGGPISLQLGLFSVRSGNLLTPVLDYVTRVSSTAGISYVGAIKPFIPLLTEGMDLIAGQTEDTELEVGLDTDLSLNKSCVSAIIARPKGSIDQTKLSLAADRTLLLDGKPFDCGYATFSIRRSLQKADYGEIPELEERYADIQNAIKANKEKDAQDALTVFRLTTIASPDLIPSDARKLVEKVKQMVTEAFPPSGVVAATPSAIRAETLSAMKLYD